MRKYRRRRDWQENRRRQAIQLIERDWKQVEVAEALGITKGAVSRWNRSYRKKGLKGLRGVIRRGGPRKLDQEQLKMLPELLWHGAEAFGFRGEIWTCRRIAVVIEREFGVRYHPHHIAKLMKELKWTPHLPVPRATQRNEVEIESWRVNAWSDLKKSPKREKKPISAG